MKFSAYYLAAPLLALGLAAPAFAESPVFGNEAAAKAACGTDEVVFVDLDHARYYHQTQEGYGKSVNFVYTCEKGARAHAYREAKDTTAPQAGTSVAAR